MKFNEPFFGIVYADFDRNSACQVAGSGNLTYHLELPLKGCGTVQVSRFSLTKKKKKSEPIQRKINLILSHFRNHKESLQTTLLCDSIQVWKWMEMKSSQLCVDTLHR